MVPWGSRSPPDAIVSTFCCIPNNPGAGVGDAYWMARAELGRGSVGWRPVIFYDIGWAGPRGDWREPGRPLSGAGAGLSILDGLLRLDVSRGIYPERQWRFDSYFEARF